MENNEKNRALHLLEKLHSFAVGTRIEVIGKGHSENKMSNTGKIGTIAKEPVYGVYLDDMPNKLHKWYAHSEIRAKNERMTRAQQLLEFQRSPEQVIKIRYGNEDTRKTFNKLLQAISYCASVGASRMFHVPIDGDGYYSLKIKGLDDVDNPLNTEDDPIKVPSGD